MSKKITQICLILVIIFSFGCQSSSCPGVTKALPDTNENRVALTNRYFELMPMDKMMNDMGDAMMASMPADSKDTFKQFWKAFFTAENTTALKEAARNSLSKNLNTSELGAFVQLLEDPAG